MSQSLDLCLFVEFMLRLQLLSNLRTRADLARMLHTFEFMNKARKRVDRMFNAVFAAKVTILSVLVTFLVENRPYSRR